MVGETAQKHYTQVKVEQLILTEKQKQAIVSSTKDKMAHAYLMALNGTVNYALDQMNRDHDGLGIDYMASSATMGLGRKATVPANVINIQLKGTGVDATSKVEIRDDHIRYKLGDKLTPIGRHFLFVVILPEQDKIDEWCEFETERVILNAKGYYLEIDKVFKAGWLKIPIKNRLIAANYKELFETPLNVEFEK